MRDLHEVPLTVREENGDSITEILAFLDDGKVYQAKPNEKRRQSSQKGGLCWYYALNYIRLRYGKEVSDQNENRRIEKIISNYRKALTLIDGFEQVIKFAVGAYPRLQLDGVRVNKFDECLQQTAEYEPEFQIYHHIILCIRTLLSSQPNLAEASTAEKNNFRQQLFQAVLVNILPPDEISALIEKINFDDTFNYFECIGNLSQLITLVNQKNPHSQEILNRISISCIELMYQIIKTSINCSDLTITQAIEFHREFSRVMAVKKLYEDLGLKADLAFFEKRLTTGVTNKATISMAKQQAKQMHAAIESELPIVYCTTEYQVTEDSACLAKNLFSHAQTYAYCAIIDSYHLNKTSWTPKDGFTGLTEAINQNGVLIFQGKVGIPFYNGPPSQKATSKIGSRTIKFWAPDALKPTVEDESGHVIIVIGTQQISQKDSQQEYVLFLDPNDSSKPSQEREVYRMNYTDFKERIMTCSGVTFTDPESTPDDADLVYAVSARRF